MALTTDVIILHKEPADSQTIPMAVGEVFKGSLVMINAAGFADAAAPTAATQFAGVAESGVDNSGGSAGDLDVVVFRSGRHLLTTSGAVQADVGNVVFAADDETINLTATPSNAQKVGVIVEFVSATQVWVDIANGASDPFLAV